MSFVISKLFLLFINQLGRFDDANSSCICSDKMKNDKPKSSDDECKSSSAEASLQMLSPKIFFKDCFKKFSHI